MTEELKKLVSKADCGDNTAQKQLMEMAQEKQDAGSYEEAAGLFKLAAMAYRISSSRSGTQAAEATGKLWWQERVLTMYREWIARYTTPVPSRMPELTDCDLSEVEHAFMQVYRLRNQVFGPLMRHLDNELMARDVEMCAPGGTMNRHFIYMLKGRDYGNDFYEAFPNEVDIRVALDPIVDEVLKRYRKP